MFLQLLRRSTNVPPEPFDTNLYDDKTFYSAFIKELNNCGSELIIESPFITRRRLTYLLPTLQKQKDRKVRIIINTKDPYELDEDRREEAYRTVVSLQHKGIQVIYTHGHHRKLAINDRSILFEGSLNILSQNDSCEIMQRVESNGLAWQVLEFVSLNRFMA